MATKRKKSKRARAHRLSVWIKCAKHVWTEQRKKIKYNRFSLLRFFFVSHNTSASQSQRQHSFFTLAFRPLFILRHFNFIACKCVQRLFHFCVQLGNRSDRCADVIMRSNQVPPNRKEKYVRCATIVECNVRASSCVCEHWAAHWHNQTMLWHGTHVR